MVNRDPFSISFGGETLFGLVSTEAHGATALVASHPISGSAPVTDNFIPQESTLSVSVIISDFPISFKSPDRSNISINVPNISTGKRSVEFTPATPPFTTLDPTRLLDLFGGGPITAEIPVNAPGEISMQVPVVGYEKDYQAAALDFMQRLFAARGRCSIVTGIRTYPNMMVTDYRVGRAKENGFATLDFSAKEYFVASSKVALVPKVKAKGAAKKKTSDAEQKKVEQTDERSLLLRSLEGLGAL